mmetsp:Transcript_81425/g.159013  ORF Transcript_81425/g.159013 Transcript_81425/m.159013 type:complete len:286 (-) Transcript_81425:339-1196(-)
MPSNSISKIANMKKLPSKYAAVYDDKSTGQLWMNQLWWRVCRVAGIFSGGCAFIVGTTCYYFPDWPEGPMAGGVLFTVGSSAFLCVDTLDFFTFKKDKWLRINICLSAMGSFFKVFGSIGFIPNIYNDTKLIGEYGFLIGSFVITCSSIWKCVRISREAGGVFGSPAKAIALSAELCTFFGAWCFFVGTAMYIRGPLKGTWYIDTLDVWIFGACSFTLSSFIIAYLYFCHKLSSDPQKTEIRNQTSNPLQDQGVELSETPALQGGDASSPLATPLESTTEKSGIV